MEQEVQAILVVVLLELRVGDDFSGHNERDQEGRTAKRYEEKESVYCRGPCLISFMWRPTP